MVPCMRAWWGTGVNIFFCLCKESQLTQCQVKVPWGKMTNVFETNMVPCMRAWWGTGVNIFACTKSFQLTQCQAMVMNNWYVLIWNKYIAGVYILLPVEKPLNLYLFIKKLCRGRYSIEGALVCEQGVNKSVGAFVCEQGGK